MTILLGLTLLGASPAGVVAAVLASTARPDGNLFVFGIAVGVVGMLGLRLVHGDVDRRLAARRLSRLRTHLARATDGDRMTRPDPDAAPGTGVQHGRRPLPQIIQGGMGVAISGWQPAAGGGITPEGLVAAPATGAAGVQVGTAFGFCEESGVDPALEQQVLARVATGSVGVRSDWRASQTGFPFRVVDLPLTLCDATVRTERQAVCDLGVLRSVYVTPSGTVGNDFTTVERLLRDLPARRDTDRRDTHSATAVVRHLLGPPW